MAINVRQWGYTIAVFLLCACLLSGALALNSVRKASNASRAYTEQNLMPSVTEAVARVNSVLDNVDESTGKLPAAIDKLPAILDKVDSAAGKIDFATGNLVLLSADLRKKLPKSVDHINTILANTEPLPVTIDNEVKRIGGRVDYILEHIDNTVVGSVDELVRTVSGVAEEYKKTGQSLRVIVEDPSIALLLSNSAKTMGNLDYITRSLDHMAYNVDKKLDSMINPPPVKGIKGYLKYGLKVLRDVGGVTYLLIRIINGL